LVDWWRLDRSNQNECLLVGSNQLHWCLTLIQQCRLHLRRRLLLATTQRLLWRRTHQILHVLEQFEMWQRRLFLGEMRVCSFFDSRTGFLFLWTFSDPVPDAGLLPFVMAWPQRWGLSNLTFPSGA
jgi:hypothetical protein